MPDIKFRESRPAGRVNVIVDGTVVFSDREYVGSAEWAQRTYGLTDDQLRALYRSYKDDLDALREGADGEEDDFDDVVEPEDRVAHGTLKLSNAPKYVVLPGSRDSENDFVIIGTCLPDHKDVRYIAGDLSQLLALYDPSVIFEQAIGHQRDLLEAGDASALFGFYDIETGKITKPEPKPEPQV